MGLVLHLGGRAGVTSAPRSPSAEKRGRIKMPQREGQVDNVSSDFRVGYLIAYGLRPKKQVAAAAEKPARSSG